MSNQHINKHTGEFTIDKGFVVSHKTSLDELLAHFGNDNLKESDYVRGCYRSHQVKLDDLWFKFSFYVDQGILNKITFEIETEQKERAPWSSNEEVETNWIAQQMGDDSGYVWDTKIAGRQYYLPYAWGGIGVFYDFKNGTFNSSLNYKLNA